MIRPKFNKNNSISEIIRVNHAGEYGAKRIYEGQLSSRLSVEERKAIQEMYEQELVHLSFFEKELKIRKIRPTALYAFWHYFGFALGKFSGLLGVKYSMLCTEAVEEVIVEHYADQIMSLKAYEGEEQKLLAAIKQFQEDENNHKIEASSYIKENGVKEHIFGTIVKSICSAAILLSKKL